MLRRAQKADIPNFTKIEVTHLGPLSAATGVPRSIQYGQPFTCSVWTTREIVTLLGRVWSYCKDVLVSVGVVFFFKLADHVLHRPIYPVKYNEIKCLC